MAGRKYPCRFRDLLPMPVLPNGVCDRDEECQRNGEPDDVADCPQPQRQRFSGLRVDRRKDWLDLGHLREVR